MRYEAPETAESAAALLAGAAGEVRVLAGGTDLLVQMRSDIVDPAERKRELASLQELLAAVPPPERAARPQPIVTAAIQSCGGPGSQQV